MNASYRNEQHEQLHESTLLNTTCRYPADSWQMNRKYETASTVLSQYLWISTAYKYDAKGHLTEASMPTCYEDYAYNSTGQRISMLHTRKGVFHYTYDAQGKLAQVNDTRFQYDHLGRLSGITAPNVPARLFVYERVKIDDLEVDRLASFQDSSGKSYIYNYTPKNPLPVAVHSCGQPVVTYHWDESGALPRLLTCATPFATWKFEYLPENDGRLPDTVILTGPVVSKLGYWDLKSLKCKLGYDHLGTVKLIADPFNELVKEFFYDSFGNIVSETEQRIYFPLGFAGGLRDIATGFVSFGYRDYDPTVGRFTTPDPALDMRGDGDIYDYCVDDPVNLVDAEGLAFTGIWAYGPDRKASLSPNWREGLDLDFPRPELHRTVEMEAFDFEDSDYEGYWRTIPEDGACKKCIEMGRKRFLTRPERPHPNCKCKIAYTKKQFSKHSDSVREKFGIEGAKPDAPFAPEDPWDVANFISKETQMGHNNYKPYQKNENANVPYYEIGVRPLNAPSGNWLLFGDPLPPALRGGKDVIHMEHIHFLGNNGDNFGFMADGSAKEDEEHLLKDYEVLPNLRLNKELIDEARKNISPKEYAACTENCMDYLQAVLDEAARLGRKRKIPLILN